MGDLTELTATEAAARIAQGDLTAEALTGACLERIQDVDPDVGAWAYIDPPYAMVQARALDEGPRRGPIHGVPFALKDIIDTADMPTGYGSPIYEGHRPDWDAPCVTACRAAGGVVMGKTVTTEFAHRCPGKTRNPHNPAHTPGGSSSGSAAAVGSRMVPVGFGTQTTADFNVTGVRDNVPSFDTLGLIARSVEDLALFRGVVMALEPVPVRAAALADLRIGVCRTAFWDQAEDCTKALIEETASGLSAAGAAVSDFAVLDGESGLPAYVRQLSGFEFARVMLYERENHADQLSRALLDGRVADGLACSYSDYREAEAVIVEFRRRLYAAMEGVDLLLTPSAPGEAPEGLMITGDAIFNNLWTTTHVPAVTLPAGTGPNGLPLGVQLVGHKHQDRLLLDAAEAVFAHLRTQDGS
jgi:amidase